MAHSNISAIIVNITLTQATQLGCDVIAISNSQQHKSTNSSATFKPRNQSSKTLNNDNQYAIATQLTLGRWFKLIPTELKKNMGYKVSVMAHVSRKVLRLTRVYNTGCHVVHTLYIFHYIYISSYHITVQCNNNSPLISYQGYIMAAISDLYIELLNCFLSVAIAGDIYRGNIVNTVVTFAIVMFGNFVRVLRRRLKVTLVGEATAHYFKVMQPCNRTDQCTITWSDLHGSDHTITARR